MRPPRPDIAPPPWPPRLDWVGGTERAIERLTAAGPVLVHFFDFAQLNSARAMPYVLAWAEGYRAHGLSTVGVHSPRFPFTRPAEAVAAAVKRLGIHHPVAVDPEFRIWRDYGSHGWPSLFLWARGGTLRWYQLGEGNYAETEGAIRESLREADAGPKPFPPPLEPLRPTDEAGAEVVVPTEEVFPGGSAERPWVGGDQGGALEIDYQAGGAFASIDGAGSLAVEIDGEQHQIEVPAPGLVELASHPRHERHSLRIEAGLELSIYSVSFAPGVPGLRR